MTELRKDFRVGSAFYTDGNVHVCVEVFIHLHRVQVGVRIEKQRRDGLTTWER